jgi:hypothetical protein
VRRVLGVDRFQWMSAGGWWVRVPGHQRRLSCRGSGARERRYVQCALGCA